MRSFSPHICVFLLVLGHALGQCVKNCVNGLCEGGTCLCHPCWSGSDCSQLIDIYPVKFIVDKLDVYVQKPIVAKHDFIYQVIASDEDLHKTCQNKTTFGCSCGEISYRLEESPLFHINPRNGQISARDVKRLKSGETYPLRVFASSPNGGQRAELGLRVHVDMGVDRVRRDAGQSAPFKTTFDMRVIKGEPEKLKPGEKVDYQLDISLPKTEALDLLVEIFTKDVLNPNHFPSLTIFNVKPETPANGISFDRVIKPKTFLSKTVLNVAQRVVLDLGVVSNSGPNGNNYSVAFSVALVNNPKAPAGSKHYVTSGAEYDKASYVWVGHSEVTANDLSKDEDITQGSAALEVLDTAPLDAVTIIPMTVLMALRSDNVSLEVSVPSNEYEPRNGVSLGLIRLKEFGTNFDSMPKDPKHYATERIETKSGFSHLKSIINLGLVTSVGASLQTLDPLDNEANRVTFMVPVYVMNYPENEGRVVPLLVKMLIGGQRVWASSANLTITERREEKEMTTKVIKVESKVGPLRGPPGSLVKINITATLEKVAAFTKLEISLEVPAESGLSALEPCSARFLRSPVGYNIPFLNSTFILPKQDMFPNIYLFSMDRIHAINLLEEEDNYICLEVASKISYHSTNIPEKSIPIQLKISNEMTKNLDIPIEGPIEVEAPPKKVAPVQGSIEKAIPWNDLQVGGGIAATVKLTFHPTAAFREARLEVTGVNGTKGAKLPDIKICRFQLVSVGRAIPCIGAQKETINRQILYQKGFNENDTSDQATLTFGDISVLGQNPGSKATTERTLLANFAVSMLPGSIPKGLRQYPFRVTLATEEVTLWSSQINFPLKSTSTTSLASKKQPKLGLRLDSEEPLMPGLTKNMEIIVKTAPGSISTYWIEVGNKGQSNVSVCGVWISSVGQNMPCLESNKMAVYQESDTYGFRSRAVLSLGTVSNFGPTTIVSPEEEEEANTIRLLVMVRVLETVVEDQDIRVSLKYGKSGKTEENITIPVNTETKKLVADAKVIKSLTLTSTSKEVPIGGQMVVDFKVSLKPNTNGLVQLTLSKSNLYDICDASVTRIGPNYPCYSPFALTADTAKGVFSLGILCNTWLHRVEEDGDEEDGVILSIAFRAKENLKDGQLIRVEGKVTGREEKMSVTLTAKREQVTGSLPVNITVTAESPFTRMMIREQKWVSFNVTLPSPTSARLTVTAKGAVDEEGRAVVVLHKVKMTSRGRNIPCLPSIPEPKLSVDESPLLASSPSLQSQLQVNFGYVSNFGLKKPFDTYQKGDDDLVISVLAQFTAHPKAQNETDHSLQLVAELEEGQNNKVQGEGNAALRVKRSGDERPVIQAVVTLDGNKRSYIRGEKVQLTAKLSHRNNSQDEPMDLTFRLFLPPYIAFGEVTEPKAGLTVKRASHGTALDIKIPLLLFREEMSIKFSLINDPTNSRGFGKGDVFTPIPYAVVCADKRMKNSKYPCSSLKHFTYTLMSQDCMEPLGMSDGRIKDCQLMASSALSKKFAPTMARVEGNSFWAPAVNLGISHYIQIDFTRKTRVAKVRLQGIAKTTRRVLSFVLMASDEGKTWVTAGNASGLVYKKGVADIKLETPIVTKLLRLVLTGWESEEADALVGVKLELFGCYLALEPQYECPEGKNQETWYSDDYDNPGPHFVVDFKQNIVYACDVVNKVSNKLCFVSRDNGESWLTLGNMLSSFEGYDPQTGLTLAIDRSNRTYLTSKDGIQWVPVAKKTVEEMSSRSGFERRIIVPSLPKKELSKLSLKRNEWSATSDALFVDKKRKALWGRCCSSRF